MSGRERPRVRQVDDRPVADRDAGRGGRAPPAALADPVGLHVREAEPEPGLDELRQGGDEREVQPGPLRYPPSRGGRVEVAHELRLAGGVTRVRDPDVAAPEPALHDPPGKEAGDKPVLERDRAARPLGDPGARQLRPRIVELGQERLGPSVPRVPLAQERGGRLEVVLGEGAELDAATTRRRSRRSPGP